MPSLVDDHKAIQARRLALGFRRWPEWTPEKEKPKEPDPGLYFGFPFSLPLP